MFVKNIISKGRKLTMTTGTALKLMTVAVCGIFVLLTSGVRGGTTEPGLTPDAIIAKSKTYQVSGTIPAGFEPCANAKGEAVFFEPKDFAAIARMEVQADNNGVFNASLPASSSKQTALRVEIRFPSESYATLEGNCHVTPDKPAVIVFAKPLNKRDSVHYYGVFLDEISNEPVPYVGIYADSNGNIISRADDKGHFDFYVESKSGTTSFLPYLTADKYTGHSYFFRHNPGESVELKLIMERGIRARVHAEDENGAPVPGVYVRWMGAGGASGTTDENGDALLNGMLSRVRTGFLCEVRKKGYELAKDPGPLNAMLYTDKPLRIVMRPVADPSSVKGDMPEPAHTPIASGNDIKVGVQTKDGAPSQASEKYRLDVIYAQFPAQRGLKMTPDEAVKLEKDLEENPDDLNTAAQLLGFYNNAGFKDPDARKKREKLILSLIQSHPDAAILGTYYGLLFRNDNFAEAQELWAKKVEKNLNSITILMNAANPFLLYPPKQRFNQTEH